MSAFWSWANRPILSWFQFAVSMVIVVCWFGAYGVIDGFIEARRHGK